MRKSILAAPVVAAAAALTLGMGAAAQASVVGSVSDSLGTAGYYTQSFAVQYNQANATFKLNEPALQWLDASVGADGDGGIGAQLCNATTGYTAQVGVVPSYTDPGTWDVVVAQGIYKGSPTGSPCDGNVLFAGYLQHTVLGHIPAGGTVQVQVKEASQGNYHHGLLFTVADSNEANFNYFQHSFPGYFNEVGDGVTGDFNILSAPATNDLVDFSGVTGTTTAGATRGLAYWNAVKVSSGVPGYAALIAPGAISPSAYTCVAGHFKRWTTYTHYWKNGKRHTVAHHHKEWIKKKCTGNGASSFNILTGSPLGY
jgi:hypothetical protein